LGMGASAPSRRGRRSASRLTFTKPHHSSGTPRASPHLLRSSAYAYSNLNCQSSARMPHQSLGSNI
jgi:hypothetical protein